MKKVILLLFCTVGIVTALFAQIKPSAISTISKADLKDKIAGGWAGKMIGVTYGAPTEFRFQQKINTDTIYWTPSNIKESVSQDDLYVQLSFLMAMDQFGIDAPAVKFQEMLAKAGYPLWCANMQARKNYFDGIFPPASGSPAFSFRSDDIDFQIEADYIGLMNPGMTQNVIDISGKIGHIMNYGDGVYGGIFLGAMYSVAFFENNIQQVIEKALLTIPAKSNYAKIVKDVIRLHEHYPNDWKLAWAELESKWGDVDISGAGSSFNIDATINGAYIVMGLLYGEGDPYKTLEITTRCGQDSDCNPSSAMAVLGVIRGFKGLPIEMQNGVNQVADSLFINTSYSFNTAVESTFKYALSLVNKNGGSSTDNFVNVSIQNCTPAKWEDAYPKVVYDSSYAVFSKLGWSKKGNWETYRETYNNGKQSEPQALFANTKGDEITFTFSGTGISLMGNWVKDGGKASIYLDGKFQRNIDTYYDYSKQEHRNVSIWHAFQLPQGKHIVKLVVTGEKNAASLSTNVYVSQAIVYKSATKKYDSYLFSFEKKENLLQSQNKTIPLTDRQATYCNPINIDYGYCPIPNFVQNGKHRATADPVIAVYDNKYFLFSTNQWGYWWSSDMKDWKFIARNFLRPWNEVYDELCAPATLVLGDSLLVIGSTHEKKFSLWYSTNPTKDDWHVAVDSFKVGAWDPGLFLDDDNRLYIFWGSSNMYPIYGQELNRKTFEPMGGIVPLIHLVDSVHGWERFGEHADNTFLKPFMEGAWMNKHNGTYYLQYGAPGTEFSGYGDGAYIGKSPLGPFTYQKHNPISYKPGGFARGAGHGATYKDIYNEWWHISTIAIGVKNNFERRNGIWPAQIDTQGILYSNTSYGDYPHYLPRAKANHDESQFTGWMLLNYNKPVEVSSTLSAYTANNAVDENIKTYWSASSAKKGEWIQTDLGNISSIEAIQINFADEAVELMGKQTTIFHQYEIYASEDKIHWNLVVDKSNNTTDVPHDYVVLPSSINARFIKLVNVHMPTGKFAISGLRVFGKGKGTAPSPVQNFVALRGDSERRNAWLKWAVHPNATGYHIYFGSDPDKLYNSVMVYGASEYYCTALDKDQAYYFQIEAFNENGISERTAIKKSE